VKLAKEEAEKLERAAIRVQVQRNEYVFNDENNV
jgi:hypothetical protein